MLNPFLFSVYEIKWLVFFLKINNYLIIYDQYSSIWAEATATEGDSTIYDVSSLS